MNEDQTKQTPALKDTLLPTIDDSKNNHHLNAALAWAKAGYFVLPLNPKTKAPLVNGGYKAATKDVEVITSIWTANPSAMIGIRTGSTGSTDSTNLFVLDIDVKDGADPYQRLEEFEKFIGAAIPKNCLVSTPSGGLHAYMSMGNENLRIGTEIFGQKGIDYRASSGYVAAPPSKRADGKSYQFITGEKNA